MPRERFSFDDTEEVKVESVKQQPKKVTSKKSTSSNTKKSNNNNGKKPKLKLKWWNIILIVFLVAVIGFTIYIYVASSNDGPVYGDRCASLLSLDNTKIEAVEAEMKSNDKINSFDIEVECRIIEFNIDFKEGTTYDEGKAIALDALVKLDTAMGYEKEGDSKFSTMFGTANGRGQYNAEFYLTCVGNEEFPAFGTKHPQNDEITFSGAKPVDQKTTDAVLNPPEETE